MLAITMDKWLRWLTRGVHITLHRRARPSAEDIAASFEHVDGATLDADDFRASDSMRLDPLARGDFAETLPGFVCSVPPPRRATAH